MYFKANLAYRMEIELETIFKNNRIVSGFKAFEFWHCRKVHVKNKQQKKACHAMLVGHMVAIIKLLWLKWPASLNRADFLNPRSVTNNHVSSQTYSLL